MATLICIASGLLTGAATFAVAEVGAGATNLIRQSHLGSVAAAGTQASVAFTVTSGKVIDGVLLWVKQGAAGSTGTFKVDLQKGGVSQASVTVNKTDLPDVAGSNNAPVFFKFTGTATGDGAANWTIVLTTTGLQGVNYCTHVSGATNITRALRTTVAQTPAAGDDLYITGELTGAGAHNAYTVTMNSAAATVYGNGAVNSTTVSGGLIAISNWGTLTYGTAAASNYILRVAGDVRVNQYGTLNIGSLGAEIPRNSTAVLEFQPVAATGDFGLYAYDNSVVNIAGLSRTSGKNIVKCKLTSDVVGGSLVTAGSFTAMTTTFVGMEATGTSLLGGSTNETAANSTHGVYVTGASVTNALQTVSVWIAQGVGPANNRYVRLTAGNNATVTSVTNGFYVDIDLQAGTIGTVTAVGTGTAVGASIVAQGTGWLIRMTGRIATTLVTPTYLINACSAPGTLSYAGSTSNFNFLFDHFAFVNAGSISDTLFNVDADTGWLSGDTVCVTSTSRVYQEATLYSLNANAGASSFTSALFPANSNVAYATSAYTHSGTVPFQAEVGLLTRNVKIRSTSTSLMAFFYCTAMATVTVSWAEFSRLGTSGISKRGIEVDSGATANPKSFTYCSLRDFLSNGFFCTGGAAATNLYYANNVHWFTGQSITFNSAAANNDYTFDNNLVMRPISYAFALGDVGGVYTNNTACSVQSQYGFNYGEIGAAIGTFSGNTTHSNATGGLSVAAAGMVGSITNFTAWHMLAANGGVNVASDSPDLVFTNLTVFGNLTYNFVVTTGEATILGGTFGGDTLFPTVNGIFVTGGSSRIRLDNVDMTGGGIANLVPHTGVDFFSNAAPESTEVVCNNCKFGAPSLVVKTNWSNNTYMSFEKYGQTAGDHRCEMKYGQIKTDATNFNTAAPSVRLTPNSTTNKLESAPAGQGIKVPVANGTAVDISVMVKKSDTTSPTVYLGGQPRLIQRANAALGQNYDLVLATATDTPPASLTPVPLDATAGMNVSFSNSDLTVTNTGTFTRDQGAHVAAANAKSVGSYYFEATVNIDSFNPSSMVVGVGTPSSTHISIADTATIGATTLYSSGNLWANGSYQGSSMGAWALGSVGCAINLDLRRAWFRVLPSGNWNGSPTASPVTGIGGITIPAGAMVPFVTLGGNSAGAGNRITCNFGQSTFIGVVPFGYAPGWGTYTVTSAWVALAGTTSTANDDGVWELVVDCDGLAGWVNVDDWQFVGAATTANGMKNWYNGVPVVGGGGGGGGVSGYFSGGFV